MLICSLIAPSGGLSVDMAGNLFSAWGGRELTWLHPREAAEFEIAAMPENRWQVWQDLQEMHVDLVVQPKAGQRARPLRPRTRSETSRPPTRRRSPTSW